MERTEKKATVVLSRHVLEGNEFHENSQVVQPAPVRESNYVPLKHKLNMHTADVRLLCMMHRKASGRKRSRRILRQ
jgi:hypothetical protein